MNDTTLKATADALTGIGRTMVGFGSAVTGAVSYMTAPQETGIGLEQMSHGKLIELADLVHDVFRGDALLEPPSICTVGGQSAGKSMALNSLCGLDILPNGKNIVTRTPIHLRLIHAPDQTFIRVDFFEYTDHASVGGDDPVHKILSSFKIALECPTGQLIPVKQEIERITGEYAGQSKNVVDRPINIRITSPKVPNLSIIDLPGLTQIALRDKGQPSNIKENIEQMLVRYISSPRTIVLAIIPSTSDVEADAGLGLIKVHDPQFERTIGVLTKTDMLQDSDIERYLTNSISYDLQVKYGYFAVRNRSSDEAAAKTVEDGYALEKKFFESHPVYSKSDAKERMGSINLANRLSDILITHLKACLPSVIEEIRKLDKNLELKLDEIGRDYPQGTDAKRSVMNALISEFQKTYDQSVTGRGAEYNTGAQIKRSIGSLKRNCEQLNPFDTRIYTDSKIRDIIEDYDGIHMSSSAISTGVIEALFQGTDDPHPYCKSSMSINHPSLGGYRGSRSSVNSADSAKIISTNVQTTQAPKTQAPKAQAPKAQAPKAQAPKTQKTSKAAKPKTETEDLDGFGFGLFGDNEVVSSEDEDAYFAEEESYDYASYAPYAPTINSEQYDSYDIDVRRCDPLSVLIDPYKSTMKSVQMQLINLTIDILNRERFSRFPKLCSRIRDIVANSIIPMRYQEVIVDIEKRITAEKRCVWTDDMDFNTRILPSVINQASRAGKKGNAQGRVSSAPSMPSMTGECPINPDAIRKVLYEYFKIVKSDLMTYIHKQIIAFFVKEVVSDVNTGLNDKILDKSTIDVLLEENKDKATKRAELYALKQKINAIKGMIKDME